MHSNIHLRTQFKKLYPEIPEDQVDDALARLLNYLKVCGDTVRHLSATPEGREKLEKTLAQIRAQDCKDIAMARRERFEKLESCSI